MQTRRPAAPTPFALDSLEARLALSATLNNQGTLVIVCDAEINIVSVEPGDALGQVRLSGVPGVSSNTTFDNVIRLQIDLRSGPDRVTIGEVRTATGGLIPATILGGSGNDTINGGDAPNVINGGAGNDVLTGGFDNDFIKGGKGVDWLNGRDGADRLEGQLGGDRVFGGKGNDSLFGGDGADLIFGMEGDDTLRGGKGPEVYLFGGPGTDAIFGEGGADAPSGKASEFKDFGPEDRHWNALFGHDASHAFLPDAFWDALGAAEISDNPNFTLSDAVESLLEANSRTAPDQSAFAAAVDALGSGVRTAFRQTLVDLTDQYINTLILSPSSFSSSGLQTFLTSLESEAPASVRTSLRAVHTTFRATLDELDFPDSRWGPMEVQNAQTRNAFFNAFETVLNRTIDFL